MRCAGALAHAIAAKTGAYSTDQMKNKDSLGAYRTMADEMWSQTWH